MTMFLKTGEHLSIENPTVEQFSQIFSNLKKESYCLSTDRRVGSVYSEYANNLLEIKRKTATTYQISIQEHKTGIEVGFYTITTTVDLSSAIKIAHAYSLNDESWKTISTWVVREESLAGIFQGLIEIVIKPSKWVIIFFIIFIILSIGIFLFLKNNVSISGYLKSQNSNENHVVAEYIIGDIVQNNSLAFRVNGIKFANRVGNQLINQDAGQGNKFLIIDVDIKNIDTESRMINGGEVRTSYNGKWLKFESPEPIFSDNFIIFDVLNPLTSVNGKVAFKVPEQLQGPFYWIPPRTNGRIKLSTERDNSKQGQKEINGTWTQIGDNSDPTKFYLNKKSMRKDRNLIYFELLMELPMKGPEGKSYVTKYILDCNTKMVRDTDLSSFSESMGEGIRNSIEVPQNRKSFYSSNSIEIKDIINSSCNMK